MYVYPIVRLRRLHLQMEWKELWTKKKTKNENTLANINTKRNELKKENDKRAHSWN